VQREELFREPAAEILEHAAGIVGRPERFISRDFPPDTKETEVVERA
jgi:hypothetical protein